MPNQLMDRIDFAPNCIWKYRVPGHEELNPKLLRFIAGERHQNPQTRACAGRQMWQSQRKVDKEPEVSALFEAIFPAVHEIAHFLRWNIGDKKPHLQVCWANMHPTGSYHTRHIHPATVQLSGVYYVDTSPGCGDIIFHDLARFLGLWGAAPPLIEETRHNQSQLTITPEPGLCLLFPAYIMHEVAANESRKDRVGIAFNINFE